MPRSRFFQPDQAKRDQWRQRLQKAAEDAGLIDYELSDEDMAPFLASVSDVPEARVLELLAALRAERPNFDIQLLTDLADIALAVASIERIVPQTQPKLTRDVKDLTVAWHEHVRTVDAQIRGLTQRLDTELAKVNSRDVDQSRELSRISEALTQLQSDVAGLSISQVEAAAAEPLPETQQPAEDRLVDFNQMRRQLHNPHQTLIDEWSHLGWLRGTLVGSPPNQHYMFYQSSIDEFRREHLPEILNEIQGRPPTPEGTKIEMRGAPVKQPQAVPPAPPVPSQARPVRSRRPKPEPTAPSTGTGPLTKEWFTIQEAAEFRAVTPQTIKRWISTYHLAVEGEGNQAKINWQDLATFQPPRRGRPRKS